jgi:hypothetical protein
LFDAIAIEIKFSFQILNLKRFIFLNFQVSGFHSPHHTTSNRVEIERGGGELRGGGSKMKI